MEEFILKVLNQIEKDFDEQEYDSIEELIKQLCNDSKNVEILNDYLSTEQ